MTEDERAPREQEFRGWLVGPFAGGRLREVTEDDRIRRQRHRRWCWLAAGLWFAWAAHPVLGALLTVAVAVIALILWRTP
jgi:hypothetical protein